jgi:hypothetical protein
MFPPVFNERFSSPADLAWKEGKSPYSGTLGPNRTADTLKNTFVSEVKKNPDYDQFYSDRTFFNVAPQSQQRIDQLSRTPFSQFSNPGDRSFADMFLKSYSQGVSRGLIEQDRAVFPENLSRMATEPAAMVSNEKDPNTAGKFPGEGGVKI